MNKNILYLTFIVFLVISCPNNETNEVTNSPFSPIEINYSANVELTIPNKIQITPNEAMVGDTITITGADFLSPENMQWEANNPTVVDYTTHASLEGSMVLFNVSLEEFYVKDSISRLFNVRGTKVTEFISFEKNKIVCKVPKGAKKGIVLVVGSKNNLITSYVNGTNSNDIYDTWLKPSEKEFSVLDASGDPIK